MQKTVLAIAALALAGLTAGSASAQTSVNADITSDTTWTLAGSPYILELPIFVRNEANLTIEAGVVVRGQPRTGAVAPGFTAGSPGALIVTREGVGTFIGTADQTIVFTTAAVDNDADGAADDLDGNGFKDAWPGFDPADCPGACSPGPGLFLDANPTVTPLAPLDSNGEANVSLWGSVVIEGSAPTNLPSNANGTATPGVGIVEGLTVPGFPEAFANYGGEIANDSSGTYRYLSLRHAGDELGEGNELNGLTVAGVGRGTEMSFIEIYCNFDDGIEWFGGTVDGDHLAVFFAGDDQFDIDQGYNGTNQYLFAVHAFFNWNNGEPYGSGSGDAIGEWDGDDIDEDVADCTTRTDGDQAGPITIECFPVTDPQMYNLTGISNDPTKLGFTPVSTAGQNRGIRARNGFAGSLLNSVVVDTGTQAGFRESGGGNPTYADWANRDVARIVSSTFAGGVAITNAGPLQALANGDDAVARGEYAASGTANWDHATGAFSLVNSDQSFNPQGTGNTGFCSGSEKAGSPLDPRIDPASTGGNTPGVTTGPDPAGAAFRGAFAASGPLWVEGWTAASQCGLF